LSTSLQEPHIQLICSLRSNPNTVTPFAYCTFDSMWRVAVNWSTV